MLNPRFKFFLRNGEQLDGFYHHIAKVAVKSPFDFPSLNGRFFWKGTLQIRSNHPPPVPETIIDQDKKKVTDPE